MQAKYVWHVVLLLLYGDCLIQLVLVDPLLQVCFLDVPVVHKVEFVSIAFELVSKHAD